jgi:flavin-dependent dehydrogenase
MLADGARPPIDKACGEGIMPDGLDALRELGFHIAAAGPAPFRGIRFVNGTASVEANFPNGHGMGVRRVALHNAMASAAETAGVELLWGANVTGICPDGAFLGDRLITARWLVGADGVRSRVRAWAGLEEGAVTRRRFGFRRHYAVPSCGADPDCMELHWGANWQIYRTPVAHNEVCLVVISSDPHARLDRVLAEFPQVTARLVLPGEAAERGAVTLTRKLRRVTRWNIALVGDASGSVDAITGEGLCLAFRQSLALAEAFANGNLGSYEKSHRHLMRRPAAMGALMLTLEGRPRLRARVFQAFVRRPALFERMLAGHVGALSPAGFAANGLALGWQILGGF